MNSRSFRRRRGSLVLPIVLIVLGLLLLLDNLNVISDIDWATIWKLWPLLLVAVGLEIILGRRVSFGSVLILVIIVAIGGAAVWWSVVADGSEQTTRQITWSMRGVERAEAEVEIGIGELVFTGESDMADLLTADLALAPGTDLNEDFKVSGHVGRGRIVNDGSVFSLPEIFGGKPNEWHLQLNQRVPWVLDVSSGVGEVRLDLSDLLISQLNLHSGIGSVDVTLPKQGQVEATIDTGIGDLNLTIPPGIAARISVDRGISGLSMDDRFENHGDFYQTEGFNRAESYIDLKVDAGLGNITIR